MVPQNQLLLSEEMWVDSLWVVIAVCDRVTINLQQVVKLGDDVQGIIAAYYLQKCELYVSHINF